MKKYKNSILLAATKDSAFALGTMLVNIKEKMLVDMFYIVNDGFSDEDKKAMGKIVNEGGGGLSKIKFIYFTQKDFLERLKLFDKEKLLLQNDSFLKRYTFMSYAMFEAFNLLGESENILYLDFDILLLKPIDELFRAKAPFCADRGKNTVKALVPHYEGKFSDERVYRTGVVCFSNFIQNPKTCYDFIYKSSAKYNFINDQVAFSLLIYEYKIKVKVLKRDKYAGELFYRQNRQASLIHAYGSKNRFWNNKLAHQLFPQWSEYYKKWLEFGGSAYTNGFLADTTYVLQRVRFHLAYKLGYAMIRFKTPFGCVLLPFVLTYIFLAHKIEQKLYEREIKIKPHLKLPPLQQYPDFASCKEKESMPYKLGLALIKAYKTWYKGTLVKFLFEIKKIKNKN